MPLETRPTWGNWAGNVRARPTGRWHPRDEDEIARRVRRAARRGERLKVVGSGHSSSRVAAPDGCVLVSLDRLAGRLALDPARRVASAPGGLVLDAFDEALAARGFAMANLGAIAAQTLAGAIATGTHGTGLAHGGLADRVVGIRLVDGTGEVREATLAEDPELLQAARVSLGALGIVTRVAFAVEPAFDLDFAAWPATLEGALESLEADLAAHERYGFWWFPHTDRVRCWRANRTERPRTAPPSPLAAWWSDVVLGNHLHEAALWLSSFIPELVPLVNRTWRRLLFDAPAERVDRSDRVLGLEIRVRQRILEYGLPLERTAAALRDLRDLLERGPHRLHAPVDVRFGPADQAWLSPAHGRPTVWIGVILHRPFGRDVPFEPCFRAIESVLLAHGGRPHWGKVHFRTAADLAPLYPEWDRFLALRGRLDPAGVFLNPHLERILGCA